MSLITQRGSTGALSLQASGTFQSSTDGNLATLIGTRYDLSDGREVIFVSNGATAIGTAGILCQDAAIVSNHQNLAVSTITLYSSTQGTPFQLTANLGGTKADANQYQGGFLIVNAGTGKGQTLRIATNNGAVSSGTITIVTEDGPNTALSTSDSKVCLLPPHGGNIIINPTTSTGAVVGVSLYPLNAGIAAGATTGTPTFGFLASKGIVSCLSDATVASVGQSISPSVVTAGAVTLSGGTGAAIGSANQTAVSAECRSVFIDL